MSEAAAFGREPIQVVELDCDHCENFYGVAPCTAGTAIVFTRQGTLTGTITLESAASAVDEAYRGERIRFPGRALSEASRITGYVGASRAVTLETGRSWPQNRLQHSCALDNAAWQKPSPAATITANAAAVPAKYGGATIADTVSFGGTTQPIHQEASVSAGHGSHVAMFLVRKPASGGIDKIKAGLRLSGGTAVEAWTAFTFSSSTAELLGPDAAQVTEWGAVDEGGGWWLLYVALANNGGNGTARCSLGAHDGATGDVYAAFGSVADTGLRPLAITGATVPAGVPAGGSVDAKHNHIGYSNDLSNAWWNKIGTSVVSGPDSDGWWTLTDNDTGAWEYVDRLWTVPNDSGSEHVLAAKIKKETSATAYVLFRFGFVGGTSVNGEIRLDPQTGAFTAPFPAALIDHGVVDGGDHWFVWVRAKNNSSGNTTMVVRIFPAGGPLPTSSTAVVTAQGSCRIKDIQLCAGAQLWNFVTTSGAGVDKPGSGHTYDIAASFDPPPPDLAGACFNTFATCQDPDNYVKGVKTLRFVTRQQRLDPDWGAIPSLVSARTTPTRLNVGATLDSSSGLGNRATCAAEFDDHPDGDLFTDPYVAHRVYDPRTRGTFWTKWIARNPYFARRSMRVLNGYTSQPLNEFRVLHYVMDRFSGPDSRGRVTLHGTDVLRFADAKKAQAPLASRGVLSAGIAAGDTSLAVTGATAAEYTDVANRRRIRIGDEVIAYTSITGSGPITFTGLTRGVDGTTAASHASGDTVQNCLRFYQADVWDIVYELLNTWAGIDAGLLDYAQWDAEGTLWLSEMVLTAVIAEPTSVAQLLAELSEQCQIFLWWDEREAKVKLKAQRSPTDVPETIREEWDMLLNSQVQRLDPEQRISQVWLSYQQVSPVRRLDDEGNYRRTLIRVDADAEGPNEYDESRVKKIFSRWLATEAQANDVAQRILLRFRNTPRLFSLQLDAKDRERWWTSDVVLVQSRLVTDAEGFPETRVYQVIAAEETVPGEKVSLELQSYDLPVLRLGAYTRADMPDFGDATAGDLDIGAWYSDADGLMPDDSEAWVYQ